MIKKVFCRAPGNYDVDLASDECALSCLDESLCQQQFAQEADINTIVKRFNLTGELPVDLQVPKNGDFTGISDYHEAMNLVAEAQSAFMQMPAEVRARFQNDAGLFLDFVSDEKNQAEAEALGLAVPEQKLPISPESEMGSSQGSGATATAGG